MFRAGNERITGFKVGSRPSHPSNPAPLKMPGQCLAEGICHYFATALRTSGTRFSCADVA